MNPNDIQVGGTHYATGASMQHWDFVMFALDGRYLEGNITKYVARHDKKNGLQDLRKAQHYLDKLIDMHGRGKVLPIRKSGELRTAYGVGEFIESAGLGHLESRICIMLTQWSVPLVLEEVHKMISQLMARYPGPAYVNPDGPEPVAKHPDPSVERAAAELFLQGYIPLTLMGTAHPTAVMPFTVARIDYADWADQLARKLEMPVAALYQRGAKPTGSDCGLWGAYWCHKHSADRQTVEEEVFWRLHELCAVSGRLANVRHVKKG